MMNYIEEDVLFDFDYPKVKQSLGKAALRDSYPAWWLDPQGVIKAANLMAFWLMGKLNGEGDFAPETLLGTNGFALLADMFERIPVSENRELYTKKSAVVKRLAARTDEALYAQFIAAMKANPHSAQIYEQAVPDTDYEWQYPLKMTSPEEGVAAPMLEFQVDNFRLLGGAGFLVTCTPKAGTAAVIEGQYNRLVDTYGEANYVYDLPDGDDRKLNAQSQLPTGFTSFMRVYYPTIIQDSLWYIVQENRAHKLLVGGSMIGVHFFELFFAPQLKEWMGPIQETSAPRAMKYFETFTTRFMREDAELHEEFVVMMQRVLRLPEISSVLEASRKMPIRITIPEHDEAIFYTCRVILPWFFEPKVMLHFRSMVQFIQRDLLGYTDGRNYRVNLVPEDYETEVGLILLYLAGTAVTADSAAEEVTTNLVLKQFLWILTTMKTVEKGLALREVQNTSWEPEDEFRNIYDGLEARFNDATAEAIVQIKVELQVITEELDREGIIDKDVLLTMLHSISRTKPELELVTEYLSKELDALTRASGAVSR